MASIIPAMRIAPSSQQSLRRTTSQGLLTLLSELSIRARHLSVPLFPALVVAVPTIHLSLASLSRLLPTLPGLLEGIWKGVLKAVPKKKTTHSKTRSRQLAGKALKDVTHLNKCPACGELKRMHYLCPHCMQTIKNESRLFHEEQKKAETKQA